MLSIEEAVHAVPWTYDTFLACFQAGYIAWVIMVDKTIVGFIIVSLKQTDCHVLNLVVARAHQHKGYGEKMLSYALDHAKSERVGIAYLEVRRSNLNAISLYRKLDFHLIGERKAYYATVNGVEDALIFAKSLHDIVT